jgi:hypothetical protein
MELSLVQTTTAINHEALAEWVEFRKLAHKYTMNTISIGKLEKKIIAAGWSHADQQRIADYAMEVGTWKSWWWVEPPRQQSSRDQSLIDDLTNTDWAR